jgi:uncharacterized protein YcbK (DUF882 family)
VKRLSPHFTVDEFLSRGATPPDAWLVWARRLCVQYLEPLRAEYGAVTIVSGFRGATHNDDVGGAPASFHTRRAGRRGAAADVTCARGTPRQWHKLLDELGAPGLGLYATHVHVDNRLGRARW